jgi:hypothetical protein
VDGALCPVSNSFHEEPRENQEHAICAEWGAGENDGKFSIVYAELIATNGYEDANYDGNHLE